MHRVQSTGAVKRARCLQPPSRALPVGLNLKVRALTLSG